MSREALLALISERIGFDLAVLGEAVVQHALAERARALGIEAGSYPERALASAEERQRLIDELVVPETWFFRHPEQFDDLLAHLAKRGPRAETLRLLCLPCASGEEAYSMAIRLLDAGYAPGSFDLLAIDLSPPLIERARAGRYRAQAFRGQPVPARWFRSGSDEKGEWHEVDPGLRRLLRFRAGNALAPDVLDGEGPFDVLFCRNLLIYLGHSARLRLLEQLRRVAAPGALFATGPAEALPSMDPGFAALAGMSPYSFGLAPKGPQAAAPATAVEAQHAHRRRSPEASAAAPRSASGNDQRPEPSLDSVRALADANRLAEARALLDGWLIRHPTDVEGWLLAGALASAAGQTALAEDAYARAHYLDPGGGEALLMLRAFAERRGDLEARARYDRQLGRVGRRP